MDGIKREDRLLGALAYPFWYVVFPLIYLAPDKREHPFLRYHAYHGLLTGLGLWVGGVGLYTGAALIGKFFILFGILLYPVTRIFGLFSLLVTLYCMGMAWTGRYPKLPYVTEFALSIIDEPKGENAG